MSVRRKKLKVQVIDDMSDLANKSNCLSGNCNGNTEILQRFDTNASPGLVLENSNFDMPVELPTIIWLTSEKSEVTVGRSATVDHCICSLSISRKHAVFLKSTNNVWQVCDESSNGIFLNGTKLTPFTNYVLHDGDLVRLSPETAPGVSFRFSNNPEAYVDQHRQSDSEPMIKDTNLSDKLKDVSSNSTAINLASRSNTLKYGMGDCDAVTPKKLMLIQRNNELQRELYTVQKELEEYKTSNLLKSSGKLQRNKDEVDRGKEREALLKAQLDADRLKAAEQLQTVLKEKEALESVLSRLQEARTREITAGKEKESCTLEKSSDGARAQGSVSGGVDSKNDVVKMFSDTLESELQCSICSELFVKATTLNCSHSFCEYCINLWMKTKRECPFCRKPITSTTLSQVLDSFIDKVTETLTVELRTRRQELIAERRAIAAEEEGARRRKRGRGGARRRGTSSTGGRGRSGTRITTRTQIPDPTPQLWAMLGPIDISSDSDDNSYECYDSSVFTDDSFTDFD